MRRNAASHIITSFVAAKKRDFLQSFHVFFFRFLLRIVFRIPLRILVEWWIRIRILSIGVDTGGDGDVEFIRLDC